MMFKKLNIAAILKFLWKFSLSCFIGILIAGLLFGMAFIIGVFLFVFTGNDTVLAFMTDVLNRILEVRTYFS